MLVSSMKQLHQCTVLLSTMKLLIFGDLISVDISKVVSSHLPLCFDISSSAHSWPPVPAAYANTHVCINGTNGHIGKKKKHGIVF